MIHSVPHAALAPVAAFVVAWFEQRVAALDAGTLLLQALDESILADTIEASRIRDLVNGEVLPFNVARLPAPCEIS